MKKIIFLDFDGVLNTEHYQNLLQYQGKPWQDEYGAFFDPNAVKQLKRIIDATDADIVVESTWIRCNEGVMESSELTRKSNSYYSFVN